jgi:hypothetical protein
MATRKQIAETLKERFADVVERSRVLGQALEMRTDMALSRPRRRSSWWTLPVFYMDPRSPLPAP